MEDSGFNIKSAVKDYVNDFLHRRGFEHVTITVMEFVDSGLDIQLELTKEISEEEKNQIILCVEIFSEGIQAGFKLHTETFKFVLNATTGNPDLSEDDINELLT